MKLKQTTPAILERWLCQEKAANTGWPELRFSNGNERWLLVAVAVTSSHRVSQLTLDEKVAAIR